MLITVHLSREEVAVWLSRALLPSIPGAKEVVSVCLSNDYDSDDDLADMIDVLVGVDLAGDGPKAEAGQ